MPRRARAAPLAEVARAAEEVTTDGELVAEVIPGIVRAFDLCGWHLFRTTQAQPLEIVGTSSPAIREFRDSWFRRDPVTRWLRGRSTDAVLPFSRLPGWPAMARHPIYTDFAPSWGFKHFACLHLGSAPFLSPGATTLMLVRSPRRADFDADDVLDLAQLHPRLRAAVGRADRVARAQALLPVLEQVVTHAAPGAHLVLDARGRLLWRSPDAARLLGADPPPALIAAVRAGAAEVCLLLADGKQALAELAPAGGGLVFVKLRLAGEDDAVQRELRARFLLTRAEAAVIADLAAGLPNAAIAGRRTVALTTVRTHVARAFDKLGVHSRLEAALLVHRLTLGGPAPTR